MLLLRARQSGGILSDLSGNGLSVQHGSSSGADSNDPKWLPFNGEQYFWSPGTAGNDLQIPTHANLAPTTGFRLRVRYTLADWTPTAVGTLLARAQAAGNRSWTLRLEAAGTLTLGLSSDGTTLLTTTSSVALTATDGQPKWIEVTWRKSDGRVQFFQSDDGATFSQVGIDRTLLSGSDLFQGTSPIFTGSQIGGSSVVLGEHRIHAIRFYDASDTLQLDVSMANATAIAEPYESFTEAGPNALSVSIRRLTSGVKASVVERDKFVLGTDDYFEVADNALLNFSASEPFTAFFLGRLYGTTANQVLYAKKNNGGDNSAGYSSDRGTANAFRGKVADGAVERTATSGAATQGVTFLELLRRDVIADEVAVVLNGVASALSDTTTGSLSNALPLRIGRYSNSTGFLDGEFFAAGVFRGALAAHEIAALATEINVW